MRTDFEDLDPLPPLTPLDRFCMAMCICAMVFGFGLLAYEWFVGV